MELRNELDFIIEYSFKGRKIIGYCEFNLNKFDGIVYLISLDDKRELRVIKNNVNWILTNEVEISDLELRLILEEVSRINNS